MVKIHDHAGSVDKIDMFGLSRGMWQVHITDILFRFHGYAGTVDKIDIFGLNEFQQPDIITHLASYEYAFSPHLQLDSWICLSCL